MQRLSETSTIKSAVQSGTAGSGLTRQPGSTVSGGTTSANPEASRAWLVGQRPEVVDDKIRHSLTSQLGVGVSVKKEWRFPENRRPYQVSTSAGVTGLSTATQPAAVAKLEAAMTPLDREAAERLVAQMQSVLPRRNASEETAEVAFDVYVHVLLQHPADVATDAVRRLTTEPREKGETAWMPSPPDLESFLREGSSGRSSMLLALRTWKEPHPDQAEVDRLEGAWRALRTEATALEKRIGPGPATDTGLRGERIAAWLAADELALEAKRSWLTARKALDAPLEKTA